ncbi:hypothetical protein PMI34_05218 [Pseudomonas sp. GM74]|uniref:hypothetical protein n=1 Tax=Pseudomonas sp. GM74 TaxID=1144336 RepID=UPI000270D298|nr:hypothetical protein [Pseudomonas sp. GM74]EJM81313.1 hypothetical protein PMI34_05218 [Pseudomonas sp. GM74]
MTPEQLVEKARLLIQLVDKVNPQSPMYFLGALSAISEFFRIYVGKDSDFYKQVLTLGGVFTDKGILGAKAILNAFISYVEAGLQDELSPKRQAEIDVVSDFLQQAHALLEKAECHPAAAAVLIGATLEEFLRTWVEDKGINLNGKKPSISTYAQVLRTAEEITKQDVKDIESWGGVRNAAAHGSWEEVNDRKRISIMLEGVNLFVRRHS